MSRIDTHNQTHSDAAEAIVNRTILKRLMRILFGEYQLWKVFSVDVPRSPVELPPGMTVREVQPDDLLEVPANAVYAPHFFGEGAVGYALFKGEELVALQGVWWGERYMREREGRSWYIPSDAAKTNSWYTVPAHRGRGYAALLQRHVSNLLAERGFKKVYARIWHSHRSSIRVSIKAEMRLVGWYIELCPLRRRIALRVPIPGR